MNISVQKLLGKIEMELKEAKDSTTAARMRERVHAIKSMCELILEEQVTESGLKTTASMDTYTPPTIQQIQPASIQQPKRLQMENEANGDSLFDF
ncbi:YwdI family protein [Bacillus sp. FJAT-29790]|nr:YwdI family protein [Bacillus sp. FJAT-29790]MBU8880993.1 YwdI family protein [Bacillus sp. FJAT-29790]